jgi:hypothetical protein
VQFYRSKTARLGLFYVLLCAAALGVAQHQRLGWCVEFRLALLRELLQDEERAPDVLYLGSSRTLRGIRPKIADEEFQLAGGGLRGGANLGNNGTPRQVNALVLEDWLAHHPAPKVVCVEFGDADLVNWPHELLSNVSTPTDALRFAWNAPYLTRRARDYNRMSALAAAGKADSFLERLSRRHWHFELALAVLGRGPEDLVRTAFNALANAWEARDGGDVWSALNNPYWASEPPIERHTLDAQLGEDGWYRMDPESDLLLRGRAQVDARAAQIGIEESNALRRDDVIAGNPIHRADVLYTQRIAELCRAHNIRLVFHYMPGFRPAAGLVSKAHEDFIAAQGEVFLPDMQSLQAAENFADTGHLSDLGAERYSRALARFLAP